MDSTYGLEELNCIWTSQLRNQNAGAFAGRTQGTRGPHKAAVSWLLVLHPRLTTTRALERFRNQVAMQRWMDANFGSVAAMYEDRHQLWGFNHKGRLLQRTLPARRAQVSTDIPL